MQEEQSDSTIWQLHYHKIEQKVKLKEHTVYFHIGQ